MSLINQNRKLKNYINKIQYSCIEYRDVIPNNIDDTDIDYLEKHLIPDQIEVLLKSIVYYKYYDKGIWNLFYRYGKTCLSSLFCKIQNYWKILILVPSLYLINQIYDTWITFFDKSNIKKICSKENSNEIDDITDFYNKNDTCILISTYHSSEKIKDLHFDICIYDEAHGTTGMKIKDISNSKEIDNEENDISYYKRQLFILPVIFNTR